MLRAGNPNGSYRRSFQRRQKNAAQRVANGMAISGFKRFSDEFGVSFSCAASSLVRLLGISKRPKRTGICTYLIFVGFPLARAVAGQAAETQMSSSRMIR